MIGRRGDRESFGEVERLQQRLGGAREWKVPAIDPIIPILFGWRRRCPWLCGGLFFFDRVRCGLGYSLIQKDV